ncbi:PilN domain-containing protein [Pseudomonas sp. MAP12]|uniref:PilN domain-containing protein n=1 Tax=Geopseudomonas aromaticivorans TaxID=2849492 RepID=A0ABS6MS28_9GAMM|nr:PilN domain-containing protein [Pseudomonas aromaticivorans]MBV2131600.1 PilN domain-containing protein [Pseudomonas aromaticivorans]
MNSRRLQLARLGTLAGALGGLAERFWQWWSQELLGLIPQRWQQRLRQRGTLLCIAMDDDHCRIGYGNFNQVETMASAQVGVEGEWPSFITEPLLSRAPKADKVVLLLPPGKVLRKIIGLPSATEAGLDNVLRFEMDRHTPFSSDQVYFGYRILERDRAHQRLRVELLVVLRDYLDDLLKRLDELGVHPSLVSLGGGEENWSGNGINLLPGSRRRERRRDWRGDRRLQGVVLLVVLALLVTFPLVQQQRDVARLAEEIEKPKAAAERAAQVRDELKRLEGGSDYLRGQQAQAPTILMILNELTTLLPDTTWLSRFEISGERVRMEGESAEASALISLFEKSQTLQNVSFASPITSNPRTQKDRFSLFAERKANSAAPADAKDATP